MRYASELLKLPIRAYRAVISPVLGPHCRFHPSCSHYAMEAIDRHGPLVGLWLSARRVVRCGPWSPGGHDPVPAGRPSEGSQPTARGGTER